jgi:hypothetical protein
MGAEVGVFRRSQPVARGTRDRQADVTDLELTVTDHVSAITGAVRDARLPTNIASVIVMPADRSAWLAGTRAEHGCVLSGLSANTPSWRCRRRLSSRLWTTR